MIEHIDLSCIANALRKARDEMACLLVDPLSETPEWPVKNSADAECLTIAYNYIRAAILEADKGYRGGADAFRSILIGTPDSQLSPTMRHMKENFMSDRNQFNNSRDAAAKAGVEAPCTNGERHGVEPVSRLASGRTDASTLSEKDGAQTSALGVTAGETAHQFVLRLPTNAEQAEAMEKLGYQWLAANAPERLTGLARSHEVAKRALYAIRRLPHKPFPDAGAHSWEAFGRAVYRAYCDIQRVTQEALQQTYATPITGSNSPISQSEPS